MHTCFKPPKLLYSFHQKAHPPTVFSIHTIQYMILQNYWVPHRTLSFKLFIVIYSVMNCTLQLQNFRASCDASHATRTSQKEWSLFFLPEKRIFCCFVVFLTVVLYCWFWTTGNFKLFLLIFSVVMLVPNVMLISYGDAGCID